MFEIWGKHIENAIFQCQEQFQQNLAISTLLVSQTKLILLESSPQVQCSV